MWDLKKNPPETMDVAFLFWNHKKIASIYFHSKCVTATLNFELIYLNVYFDCYFFLSINLIHIKHRHDISVLKSFNNSPCIYFFHSKCLNREIEFWIVFMFLYLFIHSFTYSYFFYYYLFVSLYLIYIKPSMTFLFWNRFNNSPAMYLLPLKVPHRKIEFWIVFMFIYLFIHSLIRIFFFLLFICFT